MWHDCSIVIRREYKHPCVKIILYTILCSTTETEAAVYLPWGSIVSRLNFPCAQSRYHYSRGHRLLQSADKSSARTVITRSMCAGCDKRNTAARALYWCKGINQFARCIIIFVKYCTSSRRPCAYHYPYIIIIREASRQYTFEKNSTFMKFVFRVRFWHVCILYDNNILEARGSYPVEEPHGVFCRCFLE